MNFTTEEIKEFESDLIGKGYRIIAGHYKNEEYALWKSFGVRYDDNNEKIIDYQIAFLVYKLDRYLTAVGDKPYSVQYEFLLSSDHFNGRVDFSISEDTMTAEQFEEVCKDFYEKTCVGIIFRQKSHINIQYDNKD